MSVDSVDFLHVFLRYILKTLAAFLPVW